MNLIDNIYFNNKNILVVLLLLQKINSFIGIRRKTIKRTKCLWAFLN